MSTRVEVGSIGLLGGCGVIRWINVSKRIGVIPDESACGYLCSGSASCYQEFRLVSNRVTVLDERNTGKTGV